MINEQVHSSLCCTSWNYDVLGYGIMMCYGIILLYLKSINYFYILFQTHHFIYFWILNYLKMYKF